MKNLGHNLKTVRELHNYKQQFVADYLGLGQPAYSRIENGNLDNMPIKYLDKLAQLYNISVEELFKPSDSIFDIMFHTKDSKQLPEARLKKLEDMVDILINRLGV